MQHSLVDKVNTLKEFPGKEQKSAILGRKFGKKSDSANN